MERSFHELLISGNYVQVRSIFGILIHVTFGRGARGMLMHFQLWITVRAMLLTWVWPLALNLNGLRLSMEGKRGLRNFRWTSDDILKISCHVDDSGCIPASNPRVYTYLTRLMVRCDLLACFVSDWEGEQTGDTYAHPRSVVVWSFFNEQIAASMDDHGV